MEHNKSDEIKEGDLVRVVNSECEEDNGLEFVVHFIGECDGVPTFAIPPELQDGSNFEWFYAHEIEIMETKEYRESKMLDQIMLEEECEYERKHRLWEHLQEQRAECERENKVLIMDTDDLEELLGPSECNL
jgi:hypothetical protein